MVPYKDQSEVSKHEKPAKLVTLGDENIRFRTAATYS